MSRGLGKLQQHILEMLQNSDEPLEAGRLRDSYEIMLWDPETQEWEDFKRSMTAQRRRSVRMSVGRGLRQLEAAGRIERNPNGTWQPLGEWTARLESERERTSLAYHEAGHAVISLAKRHPG